MTYTRCRLCSNRSTTDNGLCDSCRVTDDKDSESVFKREGKPELPHSSNTPKRLGYLAKGHPGGPAPTKVDPARVDRQYEGSG